VADFDFGFDFYEETQGFMLGVGGERQQEQMASVCACAACGAQ
jgi:hypothetical protein